MMDVGHKAKYIKVELEDGQVWTAENQGAAEILDWYLECENLAWNHGYRYKGIKFTQTLEATHGKSEA